MRPSVRGYRRCGPRRACGAWQDREAWRTAFPGSRRDAAVHARVAPRVAGIPRRRAGHVPADQERRRPGHLPVGGRRGHRRGTPGRRPDGARRRRREPAAGGARPPGAGPGDRLRASWPTRPTSATPWPSSRCPARSTRPPCGDAAGSAAAGRHATPRRSTRGPTRRGARSATCTRARCGSPTCDRRRHDRRAGEDGVTYGLAEFIAAEEMGRSRGYWWSPDGTRLLVARVDESTVRRWHIADPANPDRAAGRGRPTRRPAPRTPTCRCSSPTSPAGTRTTVEWDNVAFPYLVNAAWDDDLLIVAQTRDQKAMRLFNGITGEVSAKTPTRTGPTSSTASPPSSATATSSGPQTQRRHPAADRRPRGGPGQRRAAHPARPAGARHPRHRRRHVLFSGSTEPTEIGVWRYGPDGLTAGRHRSRRAHRAAAGATTVVSSRTLGGTTCPFG